MARQVYEYGYAGATVEERVERLEAAIDQELGTTGFEAPDPANSLPQRAVFHVTSAAKNSTDFPQYVAETSSVWPDAALAAVSYRFDASATAGVSDLVWKEGTLNANQFLIPDVAHLADAGQGGVPVDGYYDSLQLRMCFGVEHTVDEVKWRRPFLCRFVVVEDYDTPNDLINQATITTQTSLPYSARDILRMPGPDPNSCYGQTGKIANYPQWTYDMLGQACTSPLRPPRDDTKSMPFRFEASREIFSQVGGLAAPAGGIFSAKSALVAGVVQLGNNGPNTGQVDFTAPVPALGNSGRGAAWRPAFPPGSVYEFIAERSPRKFRVVKDFMIKIKPPPIDAMGWRIEPGTYPGAGGGLPIAGWRTDTSESGTTSGAGPLPLPSFYNGTMTSLTRLGAYNADGTYNQKLVLWARPAGGLDMFRRYNCDVTIPLHTYQKWSVGNTLDGPESLTVAPTVLNKRLRVLVFPSPLRYMQAQNGTILDTWAVSGPQTAPDGDPAASIQSRVNPNVDLNIFGEVRFNQKFATTGHVSANPNQLVADSYAKNDSVPGRTFEEEFDYLKSGRGSAAAAAMMPSKRMRPPT